MSTRLHAARRGFPASIGRGLMPHLPRTCPHLPRIQPRLARVRPNGRGTAVRHWRACPLLDEDAVRLFAELAHVPHLPRPTGLRPNNPALGTQSPVPHRRPSRTPRRRIGPRGIDQYLRHAFVLVPCERSRRERRVPAPANNRTTNVYQANDRCVDPRATLTAKEPRQGWHNTPSQTAPTELGECPMGSGAGRGLRTRRTRGESRWSP